MAKRTPLFLLRGALVAATAASIGYQVAALLAARRWKTRAPKAEADSDQPLAVSILKPVRGLEPHAARSFASFCTQDHPAYELLVGTENPEDPAARLVRSLADQYPEANLRLVFTTADIGPNRKVCNLHGLAEAARHDLLLISDSDMRVTPDYLRRIVAPFGDPRVGLVTCPYCGAEPEGVPAALEALGIAASFMPGVFVAALGGAAFAFGSTIALRRETLERIGGFAGLVQYLADDYQMGKRVADLGLRVHLSSVVVDSVLGRRSFRETWTRRLRWARTVRACRPLGHLGSALTHTTALALLTSIAFAVDRCDGKRESGTGSGNAKERKGREEVPRDGQSRTPAPTPGPSPNTGGGEHVPGPGPSSPSPSIGGGGQGVGAGVEAMGRAFHPIRLLIAAALLVRFAVAWRIAVVEMESEAARRWFPLLPISDLVEAALWFTSLFGRTVLWRGQRYRLLEGGRIERVEAER